MTKYVVSLTASVTGSATVEVDDKDLDGAVAQAEALHAKGLLAWAFPAGGSFSGPVSSVWANVAPPPVTLTASYTSLAYGKPTDLTAVVVPGVTGDVVFYDGGTTVLGTVTPDGTGTAVLSGVVLAVGVHSLTAYFKGNKGAAPSTSSQVAVTVTKSPTVTVVTSSQFGNTPPHGTSITFSATVSGGPGTPTGSVAFSAVLTGGMQPPVDLGTVALVAGAAVVNTTALNAAGSWTITASFLGNDALESSFSTVVQAVS